VIGVQSRPSTPVTLRRRRSWFPQRRWVRVLIAAGVVVVVVAAGWLMLISPVFGVSRVVVTGGSDTLRDDVRSQVAVHRGEPMLRVDAGDVARRIVSQVPNLEQVKVTRVWPATLRVTVTPREPTLAVRTPTGWQLMDRDGVVVAEPPSPPLALPTVTDAGSPAAGAAAAQVLPAIPAKLRAQVSSISAASPESITVHTRDGRTIVWGSTEDSEQKARVLKALLTVKARIYDVSSPELPTTTG
jgi:cell division protein FtsQ